MRCEDGMVLVGVWWGTGIDVMGLGSTLIASVWKGAPRGRCSRHIFCHIHFFGERLIFLRRHCTLL
jgi:hypothetical protein